MTDAICALALAGALVCTAFLLVITLFKQFGTDSGNGHLPDDLEHEILDEVCELIGIGYHYNVDYFTSHDLDVARGYGTLHQGADNQNSRQGFRNPSNRSNNQPKAGTPQNQSTAPAQGPSTAPSMEASSSAASLTHEVDNAGNQTDQSSQGSQAPQTSTNRKPLPFFREEFSTFIVKGNFMTLAALPKHVGLAEWLAHHIFEQARLLSTMLLLVQEPDHYNNGLPLCNSSTCPTMKAAEWVTPLPSFPSPYRLIDIFESSTTYSWLDANGKPTKVPAAQYLALVQKWVNSKIYNPAIFPTDSASLTAHSAGTTYASGSLSSPQSAPIAVGPTSLNTPLSTLAGPDWIGKSSGFPETFAKTCCDIMRQMFRCYAHLYWSHWIDPFYHLNQTRQLNSCFVHFMTVAKLFGMLTDKDVEPMQPLIDIWLRNKAIPAEAVPGLTYEKADAIVASANASPLARLPHQA
ncbi:MAG: hypothetical protein M1835_006087 [Candelina submexicana]|nr:MAG: hypothetical protein M1835_006087 [Candelina submexicana]